MSSLEIGRTWGGAVGLVWTAALAVEFEMEVGQPQGLARSCADAPGGSISKRHRTRSRHRAHSSQAGLRACRYRIAGSDGATPAGVGRSQPDVRRADGRLSAYLGAEVSNA